MSELPKVVSVRGEEAIDELTYYAKVHPHDVVRYGDECGGCGGAGYLRYERTPGHPLFGQIKACARCSRRSATAEPEAEKWWVKE